MNFVVNCFLIIALISRDLKLFKNFGLLVLIMDLKLAFELLLNYHSWISLRSLSLGPIAPSIKKSCMTPGANLENKNIKSWIHELTQIHILIVICIYAFHSYILEQSLIKYVQLIKASTIL